MTLTFRASAVAATAGLVRLGGGEFTIGSDEHYPEEAPAHRVSVSGFWMDRYQVTNNDFRRFVEETGYVTVAERPLDPADYPDALPELLVPGSAVFRQPPHLLPQSRLHHLLHPSIDPPIQGILFPMNPNERGIHRRMCRRPPGPACPR